jgi:hypothetical protein
VLRRRWLGSRDARSRRARVSFVPLLASNPARVLRPLEAAMDEAVWRAFKLCDFAPLTAALAAGACVNYQRAQSDLTTALMAAAFAGEAGAARRLVGAGALVRLRDAAGRAAADFARLWRVGPRAIVRRQGRQDGSAEPSHGLRRFVLMVACEFPRRRLAQLRFHLGQKLHLDLLPRDCSNHYFRYGSVGSGAGPHESY